MKGNLIILTKNNCQGFFLSCKGIFFFFAKRDIPTRREIINIGSMKNYSKYQLSQWKKSIESIITQNTTSEIEGRLSGGAFHGISLLSWIVIWKLWTAFKELIASPIHFIFCHFNHHLLFHQKGWTRKKLCKASNKLSDTKVQDIVRNRVM